MESYSTDEIIQYFELAAKEEIKSTRNFAIASRLGGAVAKDFKEFLNSTDPNSERLTKQQQIEATALQTMQYFDSLKQKGFFGGVIQ